MVHFYDREMANGLPIDPDELDGASFELVRRGFDPMPVQSTLQRAAAAMRELARERDALAARLAEIEATPAESLEADLHAPGKHRGTAAGVAEVL